MSEEKNNLKKTYFILGLLIGIAVISTVGFFTLLFKDGKISGGDNKNTKQLNNNVVQEKNIFDNLASKVGLDEAKFSECLNSNKYASKISSSYNQGASLGVNGTPASFINGRLIAGALPLEDLKKEIDSVINNTRKLGAEEKLVDISVDSSQDHVWGPDSAPVTMVIYTDFQCPYCSRHHDTVEQLIQNYGDQIRVVYRHFPLSQIHPKAQKAAEASECANEQGKFWEYANQVFDNQSSLAE